MDLDEKIHFESLDNAHLLKITGGKNVFYEIGKVVGTGLYYFCKGASAIKG